VQDQDTSQFEPAGMSDYFRKAFQIIRLDQSAMLEVAQDRNALRFGIPVVVAVNSFADDTQAEVELVRQAALEAGAEDSVVARHWMEGGEGAVKLAEAVIKAAEKPSNFHFLYPLDISIKEKIEIICKEICKSYPLNIKNITFQYIILIRNNTFI